MATRAVRSGARRLDDWRLHPRPFGVSVEPAGILLTDINLFARMFIFGVVGIAAADEVISHQAQFMIAGGIVPLWLGWQSVEPRPWHLRLACEIRRSRSGYRDNRRKLVQSSRAECVRRCPPFTRESERSP